MRTPASSKDRPHDRRSLVPVFLRPLAIFRYLKDPRAPAWPKVFFVIATIYLVMPVDLIPDIAPVIGWLDDLGIGAVATGFVLNAVAKHHDRARTPQESPNRAPQKVEDEEPELGA